MNNSINLFDLKNKIPNAHSDKKQRPFRIIAISLLFIVSASSVIIFILIALSALPELRKEQKTASLSLSNSQADIVKLELIKQRTDSIKQLIDKRPYFDKLLEALQKKVPSGIDVDAYSIKGNNLLVTFSSKSLLLLDNFLNQITTDPESLKQFPKIKLTSLTAEPSSNTFLLTLSLNTL